MTTCYYDPVPPRVWSRVENACIRTDVRNDTPEEDRRRFEEEKLALQLRKGNVLQYKKNSSCLTKQQRYAQIAKGMWTNRTRTWATQSDTYTNPNMTSLKRVNFTTPVNAATNANLNRNLFLCRNVATFKDGGSLVCNLYENPCTGDAIPSSLQVSPPTYPSSDSDVPGPIVPLYWDDRLQPWYPRQRLQMNNSSDKWPINYKLLVSAVRFKK